MDKQESKILTELTELKEKFTQVKTILTEDVTKIGQDILSKIDNDTYEYTKEENNIVADIEDIAEEILNILDNFYS
jgi:molecular chaperone GrpE (heat shock protein)